MTNRFKTFAFIGIFVFGSFGSQFGFAATSVVMQRHQQKLESLYEQASIISHGFVNRTSVASQLMLAAVCAREALGIRAATQLVNDARLKVLSTDAKAKSYLATMASAPRIWKLPDESELPALCREVLP